MQKLFSTQPEFFVSSSMLNHSIRHSLGDAEALLDWHKIKEHLSSIYSAKTGHSKPSEKTVLLSLDGLIFIKNN